MLPVNTDGVVNDLKNVNCFADGLIYLPQSVTSSHEFICNIEKSSNFQTYQTNIITKNITV